MNRNILRTAFAAAVLAVLLFSYRIQAQEPASKPAAVAPAAAQTTPEAAAAAAALKAKARLDQLKNDWASLSKYKEADLALGAPAAGENRVVFMGDSITQAGILTASFPGKPYINRGINGQTTPQMVLRFRQDVINLKPKVVMILAGINDIAGNTGPMTPEQTEGNIASMAEMATANHIRVVLCSMTPAFDFPGTREDSRAQGRWQSMSGSRPTRPKRTTFMWITTPR